MLFMVRLGGINVIMVASAAFFCLEVVMRYLEDMIYFHNRDKDNKIEPFESWKEALHKEDVDEFGVIIQRPESAYELLYKMYVDHNLKRD